MKFLNSKFVLFINVLLLCSSCEFFSDSQKRGIRVVLVVGDVRVYEEDIVLRKEVYRRCHKDEKKGDMEVVAELIRDSLEEAVLLKKYNLTPPEKIIDEKEKWIDKNTKDPLTLECIKTVYKGNREAYLRNIVRPTLINPQLHQRFSEDRSIHREERERIGDILKDVIQNPDILPEIEGYGRFETKNERGGSSLIEAYGFSMKDPLIENVLKKMKAGEVYRDVVEDNYSYKVVRLVKKEGENYIWDGVVIKKKGFDSWYKDYAIKNIKIQFYDEGIKKRFIERYPDIWWREMFN